MTLTVRKASTLIGWQTLLADLSLILFMVTAAAMAGKPNRGIAVHDAAQDGGRRAVAAPIAIAAPTLGEPIAVWRAGGSQTLQRWLASEQPDSRQQLTITAHYGKGAAARALKAAQALVGEASVMGQDARVIVAPAADTNGVETQASLAYDQVSSK